MLRSAGACFMLLVGMLTPPLLSAMRDSFTTDGFNDEITTLDVDHPDQEPISNLETKSNSSGGAAKASEVAIQNTDEADSSQGEYVIYIFLDCDGVLNVQINNYLLVGSGPWTLTDSNLEWADKKAEVRWKVNSDHVFNDEEEGDWDPQYDHASASVRKTSATQNVLNLKRIHWVSQQNVPGDNFNYGRVCVDANQDYMKDQSGDPNDKENWIDAEYELFGGDQVGVELSALYVKRLVSIIKQAQQMVKSKDRVKVVLSSTWRRPDNKQWKEKLEKVLTAKLEYTFTFTLVTGGDAAMKYHEGGRLLEISTFLQTNVSDRVGSKVGVLVLDDLQATSLTNIKGHRGLREIAEIHDPTPQAVEDYLLQSLPEHLRGDDASAKFLHLQHSFVAGPELLEGVEHLTDDAEFKNDYAPTYNQISVGTGLTGERVQEAMTWLATFTGTPVQDSAVAVSTVDASSSWSSEGQALVRSHSNVKKAKQLARSHSKGSADLKPKPSDSDSRSHKVKSTSSSSSESSVGGPKSRQTQVTPTSSSGSSDSVDGGTEKQEPKPPVAQGSTPPAEFEARLGSEKSGWKIAKNGDHVHSIGKVKTVERGSDKEKVAGIITEVNAEKMVIKLDEGAEQSRTVLKDDWTWMRVSATQNGGGQIKRVLSDKASSRSGQTAPPVLRSLSQDTGARAKETGGATPTYKEYDDVLVNTYGGKEYKDGRRVIVWEVKEDGTYVVGSNKEIVAEKDIRGPAPARKQKL